MATQTKQDAEIRSEIAQLDAQIASSKQYQAKIQQEREPLHTIYKWSAPERVFEIKDRRWYVTVAAISMIIIVYSALTGNYLLIFTVIALILLVYAINSIPPKDVTHEITNKGVHIFESLILWSQIDAFWLTKRGDNLMLHLEVLDKGSSFVRRVIILVGNGNAKKIITYLVQHIDYLSPEEIGLNIVSKYLEGTYQPLMKYLETEDVVTKDPKDSPKYQEPVKEEEVSNSQNQ